MEGFKIQEGKNSPTIDFNPNDKTFEIKGKSFHENPEKIYSGALSWLKNVVVPSDYNAVVSFNLSYISSNSMIYILRILKTFEEISKKGPTFKVKWYYYEDDELIKSAGEDLEEMVNLEFSYYGLEE